MTKKEIEQLAKLNQALDGVEKKLKSIALEISSTKETSILYWSKLSKKSRLAYEEARVIFARWSALNLPKFYDDKIKEQIKRVKSLSFIPRDLKGNKINVHYTQFINTYKNKQYKTSVVKESINYFSTGADEGQKRLNRLMNITQQINIADNVLKESLEKGFLEGAPGIREARPGTIMGAKEKLKQELMEKALDGKFIKVINKNGNPIMYKLNSYAEMVARSEMISSQAQAAIMTGLEYNTDLVQVSSHNTTTEICQQYEGKIFSISGTDKDFPVLDNAPAYHPNCKHSLSVVFKEVLERRGIQKYIDYSSGKTEIHPTRKSHIPISKRG